MKRIKLKKSSVDFAETVYELPLSHAIEFMEVEKEIHALLAKEEDYEPIEYLMLLVKAIAAYLNVKEEEILNLPLGGELETFVMSLDNTVIENEVNSLLTIFNNMAIVFLDYKPEIKIDEDYIFTHDREDYRIPSFLRNSLNEEKINNPNLSTREVVECLEIKRLAANIKNKNNGIFTEIITMMAILCRQEDEDFPTDQTEIKEFIDDRKRIFKNINMKIGLDLAFFLNTTMII